jgi:asparagine N-glycosylation enzyme membrane subunit Stt3
VSPHRTALLLVSIAAVASALRSLGFSEVFPGDGDVLLAPADSAFHARRALYSFVNFPSVLFRDPYLAYPTGAPVPAPPLYDWCLAAVARCFGDTPAVFERVAAVSGPVLAALTVVPVYHAARRMAGAGAGLGAALLFAMLPISIRFSSLGDADHHAAVALLIALIVAASLDLTRPDASARRRLAAAVALGALRAALVLTWSGSLLYVALGEGALLAASCVAGRRDLYRAQAAGTLGAAVAIAPWVVAAGTPIGGPFSATTLSWLHVTALFATAAVASALAFLERTRPPSGAGERALRTVALGTLAAGVLLLLPGVREALAAGMSFLGKADTWGSRNLETVPIFAWLGAPDWSGGDPGLGLYGGFAYAIPLALGAVLLRLRDARLRAPALCLACWTLGLSTLAVFQIRFGSDFAPVAAIGFALLLASLRGALPRRLPAALASALVVGVAGACLWLGDTSLVPRRVAGALDTLRGQPPARDSFLGSGRGSLVYFARILRASTPETAGYFDPEQTPEYGVLAHPNHGHVLQYVARRATPANNFGPYLDRDAYDAVRRFFSARDEEEAVAIADLLRTRYVLSFDHHLLAPGLLTHRLHRRDGSADDSGPHVERFRLITEGPLGGRPLRSSFPFGMPARKIVPYKLFERVAGAVLEVNAAPGTPVEASVRIETPIRRRFTWRASTRADADGVARLRVPYANDARLPTRPLEPYRIRIGAEESGAVEHRVAVPEAAVVTGGAVRVDAAPPGAGAPS